MNQLERVARAICVVENGHDQNEMTSEDYFAWKFFISEAQAAIDAMLPDIASVDRAAREECAEICRRIAEVEKQVDDDEGGFVALHCADMIMETIKNG